MPPQSGPQDSRTNTIRPEIQDAISQPILGIALADAEELSGDSVDQQVAWKNGTGVSSLAGKPVRLRFVLGDADVFSFQFAR